MKRIRRRWMRLSRRTRLNILTVFWAVEIASKMAVYALFLWAVGLFWLPL